MARRSGPSQLETVAYARQVVDEVAGAEDMDAAAERALSQTPGAQARQALVEMSAAAPDRVTAAFVSAALRSGDHELGRVAADLLLDTDDSPTALRVLQECLGSSDPSVRCRAMEALETRRDPAAISLLSAGLTDEADTVRHAAAAALGIIVGAMHHPLQGAVLEELSAPDTALARAIIGNEDDHVRRQVAQGLAFVDSDAVLPVLRSLAGDEDPEVRQEVVFALAAIGTQPAVELMATCLDDASYRVASGVLDMLAARLGASSTAFLEHLERAVRHQVTEVRRHAVLMLDRFDPGTVREVLQKASADPDFEVARHAGEMLRKVPGEHQLGWLADEMSGQSAGGKAFSVWEAGSIGLEAGGAEYLDDIAPMLEQALVTGSASDRVHAVNELATLVDIGDSQAMRDALDDKDPAVRSRAADSLSYTRDAGLLVRVVRTHPDPQVRRRAVEALVKNPGGLKGAPLLVSQVSFSSTRTVGMELFGCFLDALHDSDTGVVQTACGAVREYAETMQLCPVRQTVRELERLAADDTVSSLLQDDAAHAAETVEKMTAARLIADRLQDVLDWRGRLAREAHAVRWDQEVRAYRLDDGVDAETVERWCAQYQLSDDQGAAVRRAASGEGGLEPQTAGRVLLGLTRELTHALDCVAHAARAVMLIGQDGFAGDLDRWNAAVQAGPKLDWGPGETIAGLQRRIRRARKRAWVETRCAREAYEQSPSADALSEAAEDYDDWVKLTALTRMAEAGGGPPADLEHILQLCRAHEGEEDDAEPIGRCAVLLLRDGRREGAELAEFALGAADIDLRMELSQQILLAAQQDEAASALLAYLSGKPLDSVPALCLAMALRGAGNSLETLSLPERDQAVEDPELICAGLGLRAMQGDPGAARELTDLVREGGPEERYYSAHYLTLARVRSAVPPFASVRDRDVPAMLRAVCGGAVVRGGHQGGPAWFAKVLKSVSGDTGARVLTHLCRAVEDTIPLMTACKDVNVGRFV